MAVVPGERLQSTSGEIITPDDSSWWREGMAILETLARTSRTKRAFNGCLKNAKKAGFEVLR